MKCRSTLVAFPILSGYQIRIVVCSNIRDATKKFKHTKNVWNDDEDYNTNALTCHVKNPDMGYVFVRPSSSVGDIAHESWHAIQRMLECFDIPIENEVAAYHLGFLVNKIFDFIHN